MRKCVKHCKKRQNQKDKLMRKNGGLFLVITSLFLFKEYTFLGGVKNVFIFKCNARCSC